MLPSLLGYEVHTLDADDKHDHRGQSLHQWRYRFDAPEVHHAYCPATPRRLIWSIWRINDSAWYCGFIK